MKFALVKLSEYDGIDIYRLIQNMPNEGTGFYNSGLGLSIHDFPDYLKTRQREAIYGSVQTHMVPETYYWFYVDGVAVGIGKYREYLTKALMKKGGHFSYAIIPSMRGKGYGKALLAHLLREVSHKSNGPFLLTCYEANKASRQIIEVNGGVLENIEDNICRYWVKS